MGLSGFWATFDPAGWDGVTGPGCFPKLDWLSAFMSQTARPRRLTLPARMSMRACLARPSG
eukprot:2192753-Pyramimonas_sp.AAC.1